MQTLQPMGIVVPNPTTAPLAGEVYDWEVLIRDAFNIVNNMKIVGKLFIRNASQYATINDIITEVGANTAVIYLPAGTYNWNAQTLPAGQYVFIGERGAQININGQIDFTAASLLMFRDVTIGVNQNSAHVFNFNRGTVGGSLVLDNCNVVYLLSSYTNTYHIFNITKIDTVLFNDVRVTFNATTYSSSTKYMFIAYNARRIVMNNVSVTLPNVTNNVFIYIYACDTTVITNSIFTNLRRLGCNFVGSGLVPLVTFVFTNNIMHFTTSHSSVYDVFQVSQRVTSVIVGNVFTYANATSEKRFHPYLFISNTQFALFANNVLFGCGLHIIDNITSGLPPAYANVLVCNNHIRFSQVVISEHGNVYFTGNRMMGYTDWVASSYTDINYGAAVVLNLRGFVSAPSGDLPLDDAKKAIIAIKDNEISNYLVGIFVTNSQTTNQVFRDVFIENRFTNIGAQNFANTTDRDAYLTAVGATSYRRGSGIAIVGVDTNFSNTTNFYINSCMFDRIYTYNIYLERKVFRQFLVRNCVFSKRLETANRDIYMVGSTTLSLMNTTFDYCVFADMQFTVSHCPQLLFNNCRFVAISSMFSLTSVTRAVVNDCEVVDNGGVNVDTEFASFVGSLNVLRTNETGNYDGLIKNVQFHRVGRFPRRKSYVSFLFNPSNGSFLPTSTYVIGGIRYPVYSLSSSTSYDAAVVVRKGGTSNTMPSNVKVAVEVHIIVSGISTPQTLYLAYTPIGTANWTLLGSAQFSALSPTYIVLRFELANLPSVSSGIVLGIRHDATGANIGIFDIVVEFQDFYKG